MDIPSERVQNKIFTTYEDLQEHRKSIQKTEENTCKIFSLRTNRSLSAQPKTRAAYRYNNCSPDVKTKEFMVGTSARRSSSKFAKDNTITEFQGLVHQVKVNDKSSPVTPRLGTNCSASYVNLTSKENSIITSSGVEDRYIP